MNVSGWIYWPHFITMLILSPFPREKELQYLELAKTYLECNEPKLSLKCLSYAKEFQLSAQLCERLGKVWPQPKGAPWIMGLHLSKWRVGHSLCLWQEETLILKGRRGWPCHLWFFFFHLLKSVLYVFVCLSVYVCLSTSVLLFKSWSQS